MRLVKSTHAGVRLDDGDRGLLIDPGVRTEPEAFDGVTDVLEWNSEPPPGGPAQVSAFVRRMSSSR